MAAEARSGRRASLVSVAPPTEAAMPVTITQFQSMWVGVTLQGYTARGHQRAQPSCFTQVFIDYMHSAETISWCVCACACMLVCVFLIYSIVNMRAGGMPQANVSLIGCHPQAKAAMNCRKPLLIISMFLPSTLKFLQTNVYV